MTPILKYAVSACLLTTLAGCGQSESASSKPSKQLAPPEETGTLEVATRNGSTTYYLDRHENPIGPEHSLIARFAESKGWQVNWTMYDSTAEVIEALESGETHLAAAGLTHLPSRTERFTQGPAHTEITEQLVCHREMRPMPRTPDAMTDVAITVTAGSSYVETLNGLATEHEGIKFEEDDSRTTEILLSAVAEQSLDCTVADSNIVQVMRRHFPHLEVAMNLTTGKNLGWYLPAGATDLADSAREWMNSTAGDEAIGYMENRYYAYIGEFDFVDLRALNRRIDDRLPNFVNHFAEAEATTGMPADLLAALSYQESHWDPTAVSPTGVRGIMMLTQNTAQSPRRNRSTGSGCSHRRRRALPGRSPSSSAGHHSGTGPHLPGTGQLQHWPGAPAGRPPAGAGPG